MAKNKYWYDHRSKEKAKHDFEKVIILSKHRNIKLVRKIGTIWCLKRRNYLVSLFGVKAFQRMSISNRNEKTGIFMNKLVYLGLSMQELSEILMYEFWYN